MTIPHAAACCRQAFLPKDVTTLLHLVDSEWARLDGERGMGLDDEFGSAVDRQQHLEKLRQKLQVLK